MPKRIWAGHAISESRFAASIGELEDEAPFSRVVVFEEDGPVVWGHVDIPRTISSITSSVAPEADHRVFMALSNEGDTYLLHGDIPSRHIEGAEGFGSTLSVRTMGDESYVVGHGSQVYQATGSSWLRIGHRAMTDLGNNVFNAVAKSRDGSRLCVVGFHQPEAGTAEQKAELERLKRERRREEYSRLRKDLLRRNRPTGCAFTFGGDTWSRALTVDTGYLDDVLPFEESGFIAAGSAGVFTFGTGDDAQKHPLGGVKDAFHALDRNGDEILALGDTAIFRLDARVEPSGTIPLPPGLTSPLDLVCVDGAVWYFDHGGVARYRDGSWEPMQIPAAKWT